MSPPRGKLLSRASPTVRSFRLRVSGAVAPSAPDRWNGPVSPGGRIVGPSTRKARPERDEPPTPTSIEALADESIARGDKAGSSAVLNEILGALYYTAGGDFEVIKIRTLELMVLLSRAALER